MSNRLKLKKHKVKEKDAEKDKEVKEEKYSAKFLQGKQEKGTIANSFSGKSSKEFSRKKV